MEVIQKDEHIEDVHNLILGNLDTPLILLNGLSLDAQHQNSLELNLSYRTSLKATLALSNFKFVL